MNRVSVIVPCYNEQATIRLLLDAVYQQSYPRNEMEVIIADGLSTDRTRDEIEAFQKEHPDLHIRIVDNTKRIIPAALNCAIEAATGDIIVRLDAHAVPDKDYVARCAAALESGVGDNVGGVWDIKPGGKSWIAESIAAAAANPIGVGDARYRYTTQAGLVDTVPFGAFKRSLVERIGKFDESLLTNEDYEFNARLRQSGGKIWLDPAIHSVYFARPDLAALARQYWRYGFWKYKMLQRYPATLRWRQALPPLFVLSLVVWGILAIGFQFARIALGLELLVYLIVLTAVAVQLAVSRRQWLYLIGVPLAIAAMHLSWGAGFLWSLVKK
jgi:succinoglycan biosynthesis protein ExoA